jgi:hypothetical protein
MDSLIDIGIILAYVMLFVAFTSLLIFPVISLVKGNVKNPRGTLIGVGILVIVLIIAYIISPAEQGAFYTKMHVSAQTSKWVGAGLLSTYIIAAGFIVITLYTVVARWFK